MAFAIALVWLLPFGHVYLFSERLAFGIVLPVGIVLD